MGGKLGRMSLDVTLGEGAPFELGGAILGHGSQTLEIVTTVRPDRPNASRTQTTRSALGRKATGSFRGASKVARHAQQTDVEQLGNARPPPPKATASDNPP